MYILAKSDYINPINKKHNLEGLLIMHCWEYKLTRV